MHENKDARVDSPEFGWLNRCVEGGRVAHIYIEVVKVDKIIGRHLLMRRGITKTPNAWSSADIAKKV